MDTVSPKGYSGGYSLHKRDTLVDSLHTRLMQVDIDATHELYAREYSLQGIVSPQELLNEMS